MSRSFPPIPTSAAYDAAAPRYDRLHRRFLRLAGAAAEAALLGAVLALVRPGHEVLDAGGGNGRLARQVLAAEPQVRLTLLDGSPRMLDRGTGISARRIHGDLDLLPFAAGSFDLVVAAWALDAAARSPEAGLAELVRVTRTAGSVAVAVTRRRSGGGLRARLAAWGMRRRGLGQALSDADVAGLASMGLPIRVLHDDGAAAAVLLRKLA